jgi:DNA-binding SARP family transcriptional activator/predicted ATPase
VEENMGIKLSVRLFGGFEVDLNGSPAIKFESDKVRALLSYLMVESYKSHRRDKLAGLFWPELPNRRARSNLSQALYNLRTVIDDQNADPNYLIISNETIQMNNASKHWLDVADFTYHMDEVDKHQHQSPTACDFCIRHLQKAISLYRGEFLAGFHIDGVQEFQEWYILARERFHILAFASMRKLVDAYADRGNLAKALEYAHWLSDLDPYDENTLQRLMKILILNGQRAAAITHYESFRQTLMDEFNLEPSSEIIDLYNSACAQSTSKISQENIHNLPVSLTPFVGRDAELDELQAFLENPNCRLLTILGPGGSGKTRLALETVGSQLGKFSHGIFWIPLNQVQSPEAIPASITKAINMPTQQKGELQEQLINYLRTKDILLVLDGFEHLVDSANLIAKILENAPNTKIVVTSQSQLNIKGERIFSLGSMNYPVEKISLNDIKTYDALNLYLTEAQRVCPDYVLTDLEIESIAHICHQVHGMPLGILLASTWMGSMTAAEIAEEIKLNLDFLSSDWVDVPIRQRSLRSTFEYSWNLLSQRQKEIFKCLSVFPSGFTRNAAEKVCGTTPHELRTLMGMSLLFHTTDGRYIIHALLHRFAFEKLNEPGQESKLAHMRFSAYFCQEVSRWGQDMKGKDQELAINSIDREHENARSAWVWAVRNHEKKYLDTALDGLCRYYELRIRYQEGESLCKSGIQSLKKATKISRETLLLQARLCIWASRFCRLLEKFDEANEFLEKVKLLLDQVKNPDSETVLIQAKFHFELGNLSVMADPETSALNYRRSLEIFQKIGEPWWIASVQLSIGLNGSVSGNLHLAETMLSDSQEIFDSLGDIRSLAKAKGGLCLTNARIGKINLALQQIQEITDLYQSIGDRANIAANHLSLGSVFVWTGQYIEAADQLLECYSTYQELGDSYNITFLHFLLGQCYLHLGQYEIAEENTQRALDLARDNNYSLWVSMSLLALGWNCVVQKDFNNAKSYFLEGLPGLQLTYNPHELSLSLAYLGYIESQLEETKLSWKHICRALKMGIEINNLITIYNVFLIVTTSFKKRGELTRAVELSAPVLRHPTFLNSQCIQDIFGDQINEIMDSLPAEEVAMAEERGLNHDPMKTATALLEEFCPIQNQIQ